LVDGLGNRRLHQRISSDLIPQISRDIHDCLVVYFLAETKI
jgi:hypothetical protein